MQWPTARIYRPRELARLRDALARVANTVAEHEPVVMLAARDEMVDVRRGLGSAVEIWAVPTDDLWCRDSGPTFVRDGSGALAVAHLNFNGWGGKQPHRRDGQVARRVAERLGVPLLETGLVGEQGGVEHDGGGTLLAHASSWIAGRNDASLGDVGARLCAALGARRMIWAPGLAGEDMTDFHIDALARFTAPARILFQVDGSDPPDVWSRAAGQTLAILRDERDADGRPFAVTTLRGPARVRSRSPDFVASYVNYYVCNGAVIAPEFGDAAADGAARDALSAAYPDRSVRTLDVDAIAEMGGGIHCITQQQPARLPAGGCA